MTVTTTRKITFEEYLTYDDDTDKRYDFNDGELIEVTPATVFHNDVMMFLAFLLQSAIQQSKLPYCVRVNSTEIFNGKRTRRPDVLVMTWEQKKGLGNQPDMLYEPCLLVIEIVSPTCRTVDTVEKREEYAQFGIPEYWIVGFLLGSFSVLRLVNGTYVEKVYRENDQVISNIFPNLNLLGLTQKLLRPSPLAPLPKRERGKEKSSSPLLLFWEKGLGDEGDLNFA